MNNKLTAPSFQQLHSQIIDDGPHDVSVVVGRLFMILCFKNKLVGTNYLKEAVLHRYAKSERTKVSLTKEIYPAIAEKFSTTVDRVERAIRNSIKDCHDHGNLYAFNTLTRSEVIKTEYPPTNGELISNIANWLLLEHQQNNIK